MKRCAPSATAFRPRAPRGPDGGYEHSTCDTGHGTSCRRAAHPESSGAASARALAGSAARRAELRWQWAGRGAVPRAVRTAGSELVERHQADASRVQRGLRAALEAELPQDAAHMRLDRLLGDAEVARDLLVGVAPRQQPQHLDLALGELLRVL